MIIRPAPIDNAWFRAAVMWCAALVAINSFAWPTLDHYKVDIPGLYWLALALPLGAALLVVIGKFHEPRRVRTYVAVIGLFGVLPLGAGLLLPLMLLLVLEQTVPTLALLLAVAYIILPAYWVISGALALRRRVAQSRYFEKEMKEDGAFIYLNRSPKIDLDVDADMSGPLQRAANWLVPALVFLLPLAYLMQRLFYQQGGTPSVLLLAAALSTPLAIHVATRASRGMYLWIYQVGLIERKSGKQVMLAAS